MTTNVQDRPLTQGEVIEHVERLTYKPGWTVTVRRCTTGVDVDVVGTTIDTSRWSTHGTEVPQRIGCFIHVDSGVTRHELELQIARSLVELEVHETLEFIRFGGYAPFHPHHRGPGANVHLQEVTADLYVR